MFRAMLFSNALFIWLIFSAFGFGDAKVRNSSILGIRIPSEHLNDEAVKDIVTKYQKSRKITRSITFLAMLPVLVPTDYTSFTFSAFMTWLIVMPVLEARLFAKWEGALKSLKKERRWVTESTNTVYVDTKLSQHVKVPKVSLLHIAFMLLLTSTPWWIKKETMAMTALVFVGLSLITVAFAIGFAKLMKNAPHKVYCDDSEVNITLNAMVKRDWILAITLLVDLTLFMNAVIFYFINKLTAFPSFLWIFIIVLAGVLPAVVLYALYAKHQKTISNALLGKEELITDEESCWRYGIFYYNPRVKKMFVNKRMGIGSTVNMATKGGKLYTWGTLIFVAVLIIPLWIGLILEDVVPHQAVLDAHQLAIVGTSYNAQRDFDDLLSVQWIEPPAGGFKVNGIGTALYSRGKFYFSDYGDVQMFVFKRSKPYLMVLCKASDPLIVSLETHEETQQLYEALSKIINN